MKNHETPQAVEAVALEPIAWLYTKGEKRSLQDKRQSWNCERGWAETPLFAAITTPPPASNEHAELIAQLNDVTGVTPWRAVAHLIILAADALQALSPREVRLEEALNAILDRGPERDRKWIGMSAKDIARTTLDQG